MKMEINTNISTFINRYNVHYYDIDYVTASKLLPVISLCMKLKIIQKWDSFNTILLKQNIFARES